MTTAEFLNRLEETAKEVEKAAKQANIKSDNLSTACILTAIQIIAENERR
jgi:hypothetical protein